MSKRLIILLLPGLLLASGCKVDLARPTRKDSRADACARCADGSTKCMEAGICIDAALPAKCREAGPCPDAGPCPTCKDAGQCSDAKPCPKCPDAAVSDLKPSPDTIAVKTLVDDTFAHFKQGTLSESGAKIYVSAKGNVQLLDRLDVNGDGWLDLVLTSSGTASYIYRGSAKGFDPKNRIVLPTTTTRASSLADLDDDGFVDVVFSNSHHAIHKYTCNSYIYWGGAKGFSSKNRTELPTMAASGNAVGDLNRDGYLDLIFANVRDGTTRKVNSYIFWGTASGYSAAMRSELPATAGLGVSVADLNGNGHLDVVLGRQTDAAGKSYHVNSYIYWGSGKSFSANNRTELPTIGNVGNAVVDLNGDGRLDVIFSSYYNGTSFIHNSYVYWGSAKGFSATNRGLLPTKGATTTSVADLNGNGHLDVVFSSYHNNWTTKTNSFIYWGAGKGTFSTKPTGLPTLGAWGELVADLNRDGYLDIAFSNYEDTSNPKAVLNAFIYWGSGSGFSATNRVVLPVGASMLSTTADPGSVYDRRPVQTFTSRVMDTGATAPSYLTLSWKASVPQFTALKVHARSAATPLAIKTAKWRGPTSLTDFYVVTTSSKYLSMNKAHNGDRYIQYRAVFSHDFGSTPVLDRVEVSYTP